ncbi:hypothetical protein CN918_28780 [Priestia megaterium]|nr:hypothetical protein CN918_28780 [Priestia megaterium]
MISIEEIKSEMDQLKTLDPFHRMVEFASLVTAYFEKQGIKPIIVGGLSVEIYTRGEYKTSDIDFVADGYEKFNELLTQLNFIKTGKDWYHTDLELAIEIPGNFLDGSYDNVYKIRLKNDRYVYVIGIEDIIVHRLESAYLSNRENPEYNVDYEWAKRLFLLHHDELNMTYLLEEGKRTQSLPSIEKWIAEIKSN